MMYIYVHKYTPSSYIITIHRKILVGEKLANLANRELFTKIFLANIHRYNKMYWTYALTV